MTKKTPAAAPTKRRKKRVDPAQRRRWELTELVRRLEKAEQREERARLRAAGFRAALTNFLHVNELAPTESAPWRWALRVAAETLDLPAEVLAALTHLPRELP